MSNENFEKALKFTLEAEGGYSNDKYDPGGQTKYGISKASYPDIDIYNLTLEKAKNIYRKDYWEKTGEKIDDLFPNLSILLFDTAVNMGVRTANMFLQQIVHTKADGIIGPMTIAALQEYSEEHLILWFLTHRVIRYTELPTWHRYKRGWIKRVLGGLYYVASN